MPDHCILNGASDLLRIVSCYIRRVISCIYLLTYLKSCQIVSLSFTLSVLLIGPKALSAVFTGFIHRVRHFKSVYTMTQRSESMFF